ncbi:MAG: ASKHA domain-containing protein, partial [Candidatus Electrothrix sp.]
HGADILSRIHFAESKKGGGPEKAGEGLVLLQDAVIASINELLEDVCQKAGIKIQDVQALSVSGNTTMVHLLLGLSPRHICREPYIPLVNAPDPFLAREIGLKLHKQATVRVLPGRGSYFGGDLISGILATGLDQTEEICMLIDVGTNAEVVMGNNEWLIACAGAAGPALEGGVARMGMRAGAGAVEHVAIDKKNWQLSWRSIGEGRPLGLCGSGLIDLVAELYLARIVDLRGKFQGTFSGQSAEHKKFVQERLLELGGEQVFQVIAAQEAGNEEPVVLSQLDLNAMMRSKAAMYAILVTLIGQVGVEFNELHRISVAGAFGKHIDPRQAITLGMLPDLPLSTFQPVGNSSLRGAEMILLDHMAFARSQEIARKITYLELNVNQEFMIRFSGSRFIPHTDPGLFPSVPSFR